MPGEIRPHVAFMDGPIPRLAFLQCSAILDSAVAKRSMLCSVDVKPNAQQRV
jgi:hypothetical protein